MTTYTIDKTKGESFDAEILRQELVTVIGADGWHINTAGNQVEFVGEGFDPEPIILAHFTNGPAREETKRLADIDAKRAAAYIAEADPLFFKSQRGEVEHQVWLSKIAEIKARYPK